MADIIRSDSCRTCLTSQVFPLVLRHWRRLHACAFHVREDQRVVSLIKRPHLRLLRLCSCWTYMAPDREHTLTHSDTMCDAPLCAAARAHLMHVRVGPTCVCRGGDVRLKRGVFRNVSSSSVLQCVCESWRAGREGRWITGGE